MIYVRYIKLFVLYFLAFTLCARLSAKVNKKEVYDAPLIQYAANIHQFNKECPQEKVYLQFDNTTYYVGETIWFKAYVVNASDHSRAASKVLYVDLLNANGKLIKQLKLKIVAGQADGCFSINDGALKFANILRGIQDFPSGYYEIRAYTMNMLNFSEETVFSRVLPVFEKPKRNVPYSTLKPIINNYDQDSQQQRIKTEPLKELNVSFYPEGGHLLYGKPCRVAFKATGINGLGVDVSGYICDSIPISTLHDGMGSFIITPTEKSNKLTVSLKDGYSRDFIIPKSETDGYAICVEKQEKDSLYVLILNNKEAYNKFDTLGLTITCRGELYHYCSYVIENYKDTATVVPLDYIPEGVCQLCLYDKKGNVLATRMFYRHNKQLTPEIIISTEKTSYKPFEKIKLNIDLSNGNMPFRDRICLSVRDGGCLPSVCTDDLRTGLLLSSDIRGLVYHPEYYFESDDEAHRSAMDLLMMVQGWERYEWKKMAGVDKYEELHRIENGITLNGWVLSPFFNKKLNGIKVWAYTTIPDSSFEEFSVKTEENGYFGFDLSDFYGEAQMHIQTSGTKWKRLNGTNTKIVFERSMRPSPRAFRVGESFYIWNNLTNDSVHLSKKSIRQFNRSLKEEPKDNTGNNDSQYPSIINEDMGFLLPEVDIEEKRIFVDYNTFQAFDVRGDTEQELDQGEFTTDILGYLVSQHIPLFDLEEVAFMIHSTDRSALWSIPMNPWNIDVYNIESMFVFDKKYTDAQAITIMKEIDKKVPNLYTMIQYVTNGGKTPYTYLVDIKLKDASERRTWDELLDISQRDFKIKGYTKPDEFYSPQYPTGPIPGDVDYRRTLYWNPNIVTDQNGHAEVEFYNNSYSTRLKAIATGITANGTPYVWDDDL